MDKLGVFHANQTYMMSSIGKTHSLSRVFAICIPTAMLIAFQLIAVHSKAVVLWCCFVFYCYSHCGSL